MYVRLLGKSNVSGREKDVLVAYCTSELRIFQQALFERNGIEVWEEDIQLNIDD